MPIRTYNRWTLAITRSLRACKVLIREILNLSHLTIIKTLNIAGNAIDFSTGTAGEVFPTLTIFNYKQLYPTSKNKKGLRKIKVVEPIKAAVNKMEPAARTGIIKVKKTNKTKMLSQQSKSKIKKMIMKPVNASKWI